MTINITNLNTATLHTINTSTAYTTRVYLGEYCKLALGLHLKHNLTNVKYNQHYINNKNHNFNQQNSHILK